MKKTLLLNSPVSRVISQLGHGDSICVCDAGLPIPSSVERIDLAVRAGLPLIIDTLDAMTSEMFVERIMIAEELQREQPEFHIRLVENIEQLATSQGNSIRVETVAHEEFKHLTQNCKAIVRTGECTPYANVILYSGVTF